jgi:GT2 family glycosyltransferase
MDDDCIPSQCWISNLLQGLRLYPDSVVGGTTKNTLTDNYYSCASQLLIDYLYTYGRVDNSHTRFLAGNHLACSLKDFRQMNGFDPRFTLSVAEDRDFCRRWMNKGGTLAFLPEAEIYHEHALRLPDFLRQHFRYGRGACTFRLVGAIKGCGSARFESIRFYLDLISYPLRARSEHPVRLCFLMLLSQFANVAGFAYQMSSRQTISEWLRACRTGTQCANGSTEQNVYSAVN